MSEKPAIAERGSSGKTVPGVFLFQLVALAVVGWIFRHALNPDAVAYLRIASYYAQGRTDLAISGYWSPLISWLLVPFLKWGVPPLPAARIVMGFSAVFFLWGCLRVFRQFDLSPRLFRWGMWMSALVSIPWSVENITPDLLLGGLVGFAFAGMVTPGGFLKPGTALLCGVLWGVAYLCKSIALPLGILTCLGVAWHGWRKEPGARFRITSNLGVALLGIGMVSAPWIGIISTHSGKFTVAASAAMNHSLVGPAVERRFFLLDQGFHRPETGRVTIWEDPSAPYPAWSPLASWDNARHQLRIIAWNVPVAVLMLASVSLAFPILALVAFVRLLRPRICPGREPCGWLALLPVAVLAALYLPNYLLVNEQRYFYPVFPLLFVATAGMLSANQTRRFLWIQRWGMLLVGVCFLLPTVIRSGLHLGSTRLAGECAGVLAQKISRAGLAGSVAGSGRLPGGRAGLYVAFLLSRPWFGDEPSPDAPGFKHSGASLIIVNRGNGVARELEADADFRDLDLRIFDSPAEAGQFPLQVFQNTLSGEVPAR